MRLEAASTALFHAVGLAALPCGLGATIMAVVNPSSAII